MLVKNAESALAGLGCRLIRQPRQPINSETEFAKVSQGPANEFTVRVGELVTWCHQMVVCAKKNGKPHCTVDVQALNCHATCETNHTQNPFHQARLVSHNTKKTVFDCWNGYHSIPLHKDDYYLTTLITP